MSVVMFYVKQTLCDVILAPVLKAESNSYNPSGSLTRKLNYSTLRFPLQIHVSWFANADFFSPQWGLLSLEAHACGKL